MARLYYTQSNGTAAFLTAFIGGLQLECELVDISVDDVKTAAGKEIKQLNRTAELPCLVVKEGKEIHKEAIIMSYFADKVGTKLAPPHTSFKRVLAHQYMMECHELLTMKLNDLLKNEADGLQRDNLRTQLATGLETFEEDIKSCEREFLVGNNFSIADIYLITALSRAATNGIQLETYPSLKAYHDKIADRADIKAAMDRLILNPAVICENQTKCMPLCPLNVV